MIDGVVLVAIIIPAMIGLFTFMVQLVTAEGGTKGISKDAYYGRKTGKQYTADKSREQHIV